MKDKNPTLLSRTERFLERITTTLGGVLLLAMMFHIVADVFGKYLLNRPITGTLEIVSYYYMVAIVFLPLAVTQRKDSHIRVEIFTTLLPPRFINVLDFLAALLSFAYVAALGWYATREAIKKTAILEKIQIGGEFLPIWIARWIVPLGVFVFLLSLLLALQAALNRLRSENLHE